MNKGDTLAITRFSIGIDDLAASDVVQRKTVTLRVPPWAAEFNAGAVFALRRRMKERNYNLNDYRVQVVNDGWGLEVGLRGPSTDLVREATQVAERVLDAAAVESFQASDLLDPFREYGTWFGPVDARVLRAATANRMALSIRAEAEVRDPAGNLRPGQGPAGMSWHASHAYFRQSQLTENLHEAYRNLFLCLECLLSEVYPWNQQLGEAQWLEKALKYVLEGYGVPMSQFIENGKGNAYRQFIREQYQAKRCALFHAKLDRGPLLPGDIGTRADLATATRRLGALCMRLTQLMTGAPLQGGGVTYTTFRGMVMALQAAPMYVSERTDFDLAACVQGNPVEHVQEGDPPGVHRFRAAWDTSLVPAVIRRGGVLVAKEGALLDGVFTPLDIRTGGARTIELMVSYELVNSGQMKEWVF